MCWSDLSFVIDAHRIKRLLDEGLRLTRSGGHPLAPVMMKPMAVKLCPRLIVGPNSGLGGCCLLANHALIPLRRHPHLSLAQRFDLRSGSTFDLWADDVSVRAVRIVAGEVWVAPEPTPRAEASHWRRCLHDGLSHNISLLIGKAVLGATAAGVSAVYSNSFSVTVTV
jgi:hypothetical protein